MASVTEELSFNFYLILITLNIVPCSQWTVEKTYTYLKLFILSAALKPLLLSYFLASKCLLSNI